MSGPKRRMAITPAQAVYLRDLVADDLVQTELTKGEQQQARAILRKLKDEIDVFETWGVLPHQLEGS